MRGQKRGGKGSTGLTPSAGRQRAGATLSKLGTWQCLSCDTPCEDGDEATPSIECFNCKQWVHQTCAGLKPDIFKQLTENPRLQWVCEPCTENKNDGQTRLETKIDKMIDLFNRRLETIEREIGGEGQERKIEEIVDKKLAEALEERDEKEKRKNNILIVNLKESTRTTTDEKKEDDMTELIKIMDNCDVTIDKDELINPIRLGKEGGNRPRMLKVTISSEGKKKEIMKKAVQANKEVRDPKKRLYINNDLTLKERQKFQELLAEKKERMARGEKDWVIRNGKLTKKTNDNRPDNENGKERGSNDKDRQ